MEVAGRMRKGVCTAVGRRGRDGRGGPCPASACLHGQQLLPACTSHRPLRCAGVAMACGHHRASPVTLVWHNGHSIIKNYRLSIFFQASPITFKHTYLILVSKRFSLSLKLFSLKKKKSWSTRQNNKQTHYLVIE